MMRSTLPTTDRLEAAHKSLAESAAKIAELEASRAATLIESDGIEDVKRLDFQLATHRQEAAIYDERIAALTALQDKEESARVAGDRPAQGECCPKTGRLYERGSGALTRRQQTALFVAASGKCGD